MATGQRRNIINDLVTQLQKINGGISTFDGAYTYKLNLFNNVFRRIKFIDEVNDFPSVYIQAAEEVRIYETNEFTQAELPIVIRCYVNSANPTNNLDDLAQDIEHVIYNNITNPTLGILDITIDSISTDEGLIEPFGIGELFITVLYELNR